jgi:zinc protease
VTSRATSRPQPLRVAALLLIASAVAVAALVPLEAAVRPPRLQYEMLTLPNGLRVILSEDHSTPIVHVSVTYHVGSKNERAGRTGFAHLFEHMMFKGSRNVAPESHGSYIASVGGVSNAYTTEDETVFWQTLPAHSLPLALWLEADRMATLRVDIDALAREVEVVKEERRMRIENQPYGRLSEIIYEHAFSTHPYRHPTSGSMIDLEAASIEDVREFHDTFYVPENATLTIVGDFDREQAVQLVSQYFERVPAAARPVPRDIAAEPRAD